ncbi:MAG: signal peptidase I [Alphaproteobacteria bacterium]|nr:signal peptidase I [Alphaproteobacteria bacterium]
MPIKPKNRVREWFDTLFYGILIAIIFRSLFLEPFNIPSGSMIPSLHIGDHIFITKWSYGYSRYSFPFGSWKLWNGRVFGKTPKMGDVIVFRNPANESLDYVKRLVGLPGDTIQVKKGRLYINGEMMERKDPRPYVVATLPKSLRSVGYYRDNMMVKGNKIWVDNEPAKFNYTIEYKSDDLCRYNEGLCGVFDATEYTEVLPNGVEHSILEFTDSGPMDNTAEYVVPEKHLFFMGDNRDNSNDSRADVGFVPMDYVLGRVWAVWYSHNYAAPMLMVWNWNAKMRWDRFGKGIH